MLLGTDRTPFVGRERELGILLRHLELAGRGQGRVVLLGGEPGIGKTRLALEVAAHARAQGWQVMLGHAYETEGMPPYLPFTEALQEHVRACPLDDLRTQLGRGAPEVARLIPAVAERLSKLPASPSLSPEHERYRLFESVCDFVLTIPQFGESRGLLLVLDDLQWADRSTLLLLTHLARRLARAPVLVAGTYRTVDLGHDHPLSDLLADLRREELGEQLNLGPLAATEAAALIAAISGIAVAPDAAQAVYHSTEGTPFYLGELVRQLQAEGRDLTEPLVGAASWEVPAGVQQVVGKRLRRLSAETGRILQMAAVLGEGFTFEVLRIAAGNDSEPLMDALDEAVVAGVLREQANAYGFSHDLIRQTVAEELSLPRRQRLHLRAAEAIERVYQHNLGPHVAALAFHYQQAGANGSSEKALTYSEQAAGVAAASFAWEKQAAHLEAALDLVETGHDKQRCELLIALGEAQQRAGELETAKQTFRLAAGTARELKQPEIFGRAVLGIVFFWGAGGWTYTEEADRWLGEALILLGEDDSVLRARLLARLAPECLARGDFPEAARLAEEAVQVARRIGDPGTLGNSLRSRHVLLMAQTHVEKRLAVSNEMIRLGERAGDRELALAGRHWRFVDLLELGDRSAFDLELPTYVRLAEELRQPYYLWLALVKRGMQALLEGRFAEAGILAREAQVTGRVTHGAIPGMRLGSQVGTLALLQGRREDMEAFLAARSDPPALWPQSLLGCVYSELGFESQARRIYDHGLTAKFGILSILGPKSSHPGAWSLALVGQFCQLCALLGDELRAKELYDRLCLYEGHCFVMEFASVCIGAFDHCLGLLAVALGRFGDAMRHFERAIEINQRLGARPLVANSQREYGAMLLKQRGPGVPARARGLLGQALATYTELGMEHWAAKAETLLAQQGPPPNRGVSVYPDGLSEREVEVLRLVAAGKSTRDVADELVISTGTVERHITNLYRKIGARGRSDATAYALRHSLALSPMA